MREKYYRHFKGCWELKLTLTTSSWYMVENVTTYHLSQGYRVEATTPTYHLSQGYRVEATTPTYHLAPGATFNLTCQAYRVVDDPNRAFSGYDLTIVTPGGRRLSKGPVKSLVWPDLRATVRTTVMSEDPNVTSEDPSVTSEDTRVTSDGVTTSSEPLTVPGEYGCLVLWPGEPGVLTSATINVGVIDSQRAPSLSVDPPSRLNHTLDHTVDLKQSADVFDTSSRTEPATVDWIIRFSTCLEPYFIWTHPSGKVLLNGTCTEVGQEDQCHQGFLTLHLLPPYTLQDAGDYNLTLLLQGHPPGSVHTTFDVFSAPFNTSVTMETTRGYVLINQDVKVKCHSWGNPTPTLALYPCSSADCTSKDEAVEARASDFQQETRGSQVVREWTLTAAESRPYTCRARNTYGSHTSRPVHLLVSDAASLREHDLEVTECVVEGDNVTLTCRVSVMVSLSGLVWTSVARQEEYETNYSRVSVADLGSVAVDDEGEYVCRSVARGDSSSSKVVKTVHLQVRRMEAPTWATNVSLNTTYDLHKRETLVLDCSADGVPSPTFHWTKDGREVTPSETEDVVLEGAGRVLKVQKAMPKDAGRYECLVENRAGKLLAWFLAAYVPSTQVHHSSLWAAVGVLVPLLVVVTFLYISRYFWNLVRSRRYLLMAQKVWEEGNVAALNSNLCLHHQADLLPFQPKFEFSRDNITFDKLLGCGAFGRVYRAVAANLSPGQPPTTVAVKMVKSRHDKTQLQALQSELKILMHIGKHVNIVNLVAACSKSLYSKGELMILVEYCRHGNILDYLRRHRSHFINQVDDLSGSLQPSLALPASVDSRSSSNEAVYISVDRVAFTVPTPGTVCLGTLAHQSQQPLLDVCGSREVTGPRPQDSSLLHSDMTCVTLISDTHNMEMPSLPTPTEEREKPLCSRDLLCWAFQIARGMDYLSYRKVLHGDLAARNVLLAENNVVKISDFGLAKNIYKYSNYKKNKNSPLPVKWMSVEALRDGVFSTQSDVWAFGVVLWEMFSLGQNPFPGVDFNESFIKELEEGHRMERPKFSTRALYEVMTECWRLDPQLRPSFTRLEQDLGHMLTKVDLQYFEELQQGYEQEAEKETQEAEGSSYLNMVCAPDYCNMIDKEEEDPHHPKEGCQVITQNLATTTTPVTVESCLVADSSSLTSQSPPSFPPQYIAGSCHNSGDLTRLNLVTNPFTRLATNTDMFTAESSDESSSYIDRSARSRPPSQVMAGTDAARSSTLPSILSPTASSISGIISDSLSTPTNPFSRGVSTSGFTAGSGTPTGTPTGLGYSQQHHNPPPLPKVMGYVPLAAVDSLLDNVITSRPQTECWAAEESY
ncbi:vascular endothelial growth factor receptor 1 [Procambarus clarkii]|uniref:vascular endothelial growth factor receptor 1 n=1 Tax=Procambarus clarkii TaxID=6728 RepID=UPI003744390F